MRHFDLAIIGTGSGNSIPEELSDWSIAILEEGVFGGTCLNVGCIPTKMFAYPADVAQMARTSEHINVRGNAEIDFAALQERVFAETIDPIAADGEHYRREECGNISVYSGRASLHSTDPDGIIIDTGTGERICARQVLLAAGARPAAPAVVENTEYYTNETIMRIPTLPQRLLIMGSGYIGCEFAHIFAAAGSQVTITGRSDVLLKHQDRDIAETFTEAARERWDVRLGVEITELHSDDGVITATFSDGASVQADALLVATGRTPNGDRVDAAAIGIELDGTRVLTDKWGRTTVPGVWAIGDITSEHQLKHVANAQARAVFANIAAAGRGEADGSLTPLPTMPVPAAVFTHPQVASVGLTEAQARAQGRQIRVGRQQIADVAYGWAMGKPAGLCKVIIDAESDLIVGAHIVGHEAALLVQPLVQAMSMGTPAAAMARGQYWIHPSLSEVVENALLGAH